MIRGLRPTDVLAYISFRKRVGRSNEAILRPDGRTSPLSLQSFIGRSLSLEPGRGTWIKVGGGEIGGLVAAKARWGAAIWDLDQLVSLPGSERELTYIHLLQHISASAAHMNVHKVLLRLDSQSEALNAARQAGFYHYTTERVYRLAKIPQTLTAPDVTVRPRAPADQQGIFHLYCSTVPAGVRQIEGMTLHEWRMMDGWHPQPMTWQSGIRHGRKDLVAMRASSLVAVARADLSSHVVSIMLHSGLQSLADSVIGAFLALLPAESGFYFAVREYQGGVIAAVERLGAEHVASHALLARVTTVRVAERKLMPVRA